MIQGYGPVTQALLGTLLTWGLTAAGSAMVIFLRGNQVNGTAFSLFSHNCNNFKFDFYRAASVEFLVHFTVSRSRCAHNFCSMLRNLSIY